jgi:hypothetical protein
MIVSQAAPILPASEASAFRSSNADQSVDSIG